MALTEEIARLTGTLKFNVEARPLVAFEKRLNGVLGMLRELSTLANKKFTVKVALDSISLRSQIEKATRTKISLTNVDISQEALTRQGHRIQEYLDKTTINLRNVKFDVAQLVEQKRFIRTMIGQMSLVLPIKMNLTGFEARLRAATRKASRENPVHLKVEVDTRQLLTKLRWALRKASRAAGKLKIRVADPQVRLKVDKQHLIDEIKAALASSEFRIRINARDEDLRRDSRRRGSRDGGRGSAERGLGALGGFARGAIPGLGAMFAFDRMNEINQRVTAATNSLEAVSKNDANFKSNQGFLQNITHEMGLNFRDVAPQFSSIFQAAGSSIGVKGTQDMFRGIMQFGTVHGLDKEAMKGSMVALSQMFGKDKIQSEEARQQFAERMPNGMALLAQAAQKSGLTKNGTVAEFGDLMQKGKADPKKILPELGRLMKEASERNNAYEKSLQTTRVAQGRMNTAFEDSVIIFSKGGFDKGMASFFNSLTDSMERAKPLTEALGGAFEMLVRPVNALIRIIGALGENWGKFADSLGVSKKALATLASAVAIFMLPFGGFIAAIGIAALALDDFLTYMAGGKSVFGDWVKKTEGAQEKVDNVTFAVDGLKAAWKDFKESLSGAGENPFKDWKLDDLLLSGLEDIKTLVDEIASTLRMFTKLKNGDFKGAAAEFGMGGSSTNVEPVEKPGWWVDLPGKFQNLLADQYQKTYPSLQQAGRIPQPATAADAYNSRTLTASEIPGVVASAMAEQADKSAVGKATTIEVTVPITVQGMMAAGDLTTLVAEPMKQAAEDAFRQALGTARAQQAERQ
ncbi:putative tape measure protein [Pseudomonas phage vB_PsyM_KIL3b]|uniref:Putative tape measure protein n=3 Tax=Pseudomonas phage vB_PsyM_KIL1 TaxID=1777065 RepID=A0A142IFY0_9CAUD|nr:tail length tape measure protein [Pseudomonas phage vB_PsyM_KIL1]AMR57316.1 putative tape measure protein [Pseudomonas phage vB_PsyM_KIL1]AMR57637.1 putative tape measure protein [Pseudomonas phage vB_PsyM_KIL3]AMR58135.1 putative tape measure protein [Pseudomonas phage vB_PsyM_KIL3b]